jgi:hypothetical protein
MPPGTRGLEAPGVGGGQVTIRNGAGRWVTGVAANSRSGSGKLDEFLRSGRPVWALAKHECKFIVAARGSHGYVQSSSLMMQAELKSGSIDKCVVPKTSIIYQRKCGVVAMARDRRR